jgi:L-glyceraldehyde 3-phosphate reductase
VGVSNYQPAEMLAAIKLFNELKTPFIIHQPKYSMFVRWVEDGLLDALKANGIGCSPFSPLAQGLLSNIYLKGIPADSRAAKAHGFLKEEDVSEEKIKKILLLKEVADARNQSISQLAISWLLRTDVVTSVLLGASSVEQLQQNLVSLENTTFTQAELDKIEAILK